MSAPLHLILLAGGQGSRAAAGDDVPKQFRSTPRGPLFAVSLDTFRNGPPRDRWHLASLTVTAGEEWRETVAAAVATTDLPWLLAAPGATRTASTWNATEVLRASGWADTGHLVAVHDAARPFATADLLDALACAALQHGGAVPGVPVPDTIVQHEAGPATYLRRETLLAVQTPQVFAWSPFFAAHVWANAEGRDFTDDGGLLAVQGHSPVVVAGEDSNWKVTTTADWQRARDLLGPVAG